MDKYIIEKYGAENLARIKRNLSNGPAESKRRFVAKYPGADTSKFEFSPNLTESGDIDEYTVHYKISDSESYNITSNTFKNNREWTWYLYQWSKIWSTYGTVQPYVKNSIGTSYNIDTVRVYVNNDQFFDANLTEFSIDDSVEEDDIESNSHLASVYAAYIATYSCGISTKHLTYGGSVPRIITSIARYHLYYHMKRFIRKPGKMKRYITDDMRAIIVGNKPTQYEWTDKTKFVYFDGSDVSGWVSKQPPGSVKDAVYKVSVAGPVVEYKKRRGWTVGGSLDDYKLFIATESNGLTKTGQLLLQQSIESYVYCVLGSQAKTRWSIVGRGAMSLQTQSVFLKLVLDTIAQDDQTIAVSNMRRAIKDTNVVLNMAVSPGIILIPSDMTILTEMVLGYNNILTLAGKGMKFGVNDAVNYLNTGTEDGVVQPTKKPQTTTKKTDTLRDPTTVISHKPNSTYMIDIYILITTLVGGVLFSRYVI